MAKFKWHYRKRKPDPLYRAIVRSQRGVGQATLAVAEQLKLNAEAVLAPHHARNAGDTRPKSYITAEAGSLGVDAFTTLNSPDGAALQIEWETGALRKGAGLPVDTGLRHKRRKKRRGS